MIGRCYSLCPGVCLTRPRESPSSTEILHGIQSPSESESSPFCKFCLKQIHGEHLTYSNRIK
jgi:hypothetical protein